jgi:hypothetical protein
MGRPLDTAAVTFLEALASLDKQAVDLSPETRAALGIDAEPKALNALEAEAGAAAPTAEASPDAAMDLEDSVAPAPTTETPAEDHVIDARSSPVDAEPAAEVEKSEPIAEPNAAPPPPARATHGQIFSARRTHPMSLFDVLEATYGDDWLFWEPETLWWAIRRDFGPVGELTRNKIQALRLAATSYSPWSDWDVFEKCGLAWNDVVPVFGAWQPMSPSQVAFTVEVLRELHPEAPWDHEVAAYEAAVLHESGFVYAPQQWFPGAQAILDRHAENAAFKAEVQSTWEKLAGRDLSNLEWRADQPLDVHIARLFVVKMYLGERAALRGGDPAEERGRAASTPTSPPVA